MESDPSKFHFWLYLSNSWFYWIKTYKIILSISSDAKIKWDNLNKGHSTVLCIWINTHYYFGRTAKFSAIAFTKIAKTNNNKKNWMNICRHFQRLPLGSQHIYTNVIRGWTSDKKFDLMVYDAYGTHKTSKSLHIIDSFLWVRCFFW